MTNQIGFSTEKGTNHLVMYKNLILFALQELDDKNGIKLLDLWKTITKKHSFKQENIPLTFPLFKNFRKWVSNHLLGNRTTTN